MIFELQTTAIKVKCYSGFMFCSQKVLRTTCQMMTQVSAGNELVSFCVLQLNNEGPRCEARELVVAGI